MLASQWQDSAACEGSPSSVYITNTSNPYYDFVVQEYGMGTCGNYYEPESLHCCYASLDLDGSKGVQSGSHYLQNVLPRMNANYCWIMSNNFDGYQQLMILPNKCVDGKYKCTLGPSVLNVYDGNGCTQPLETHPLDASVHHSRYGDFTWNVSYLTGQNYYIWVSQTPSTVLVPNLSRLTPPEILAVPLYIGALLIGLWTCYVFISKYIKTKSSFMFSKMIQQIMWTVWLVAKFFYWTTVFSTTEGFAIYSQIMNAAFNIATLQTILGSAAFVNKYYKWKNPLLPKINYGLLIFAHLVLTGENYFDNMPNPMQNLLITWRSFAPFWILVLYVYDVIPVLVTLNPLLDMYKEDNRVNFGVMLSKLWENDKRLVMSLVLQVPIVVVHVVVTILKSTTVFGTDRTILAVESAFCFLLMLHGMLVVFFLERMPSVLKIVSHKMKSLETKAKPATLYIARASEGVSNSKNSLASPSPDRLGSPIPDPLFE
ncbi:hypothetical protein EDD86DRAFT_250287 [Gorgonomyces haynaldii]|nr:hypothetical protein EDD86DRAFT_250287 [Gorgonomyces haynaldii]